MLLNFGIYCRRGPFCNGFALTFDAEASAQLSTEFGVQLRSGRLSVTNGELRGGPGGGHQSRGGEPDSGDVCRSCLHTGSRG